VAVCFAVGAMEAQATLAAISCNLSKLVELLISESLNKQPIAAEV